MNKQGLLIRLILTLILMCTNAGLYAYDIEVNSIYYNLNHTEKTAEVTYKSNDEKYTGNIIIPENIRYNGQFYSVTSIGNGAFLGCSGLISVSIPNSVTSIGGASFMNCSNLTSITIPSSVTSIGNKALINCSGLTSITISNGVKSIGESAFCGCSGLTSITIPNSVTSIGGLAFEVCSGLTSIIVSSGNTKYDSRNNCNALIETSSNTLIRGCKNTIIPSSVTSIGNCAFSSCRDLTSITIPSSVTSIGSDAFIRCSGLTSVTISNGVKRIGHSAFHYCSSLTSITIPNSVTGIGIDAFNSCSDLTSIISEIMNPFQIDESVFYGISTNAKLQVPQGTKSTYKTFSGWIKNFKTIVETTSGSDLPNIKFADANVKAICVDNWDTNGDGELSEEEAAAVKNLGTVFKDNKAIISFHEFKYFTSVTSISNDAFFGCSGLTSITIPNSVISIGDFAFAYCSGLTIITIPNSVTSIGYYAFMNCSGLTTITIPNSVTSIDNLAFSYCFGLASITISNSVTSIGDCAFYGCNGLTSITVSSGNPQYDSRNNCNAIIETSSKTLLTGCMNTIIPNSVTSIGNYAFYYCTGLTSITIPNSVTSIGDYAFEECIGLTSITISNSVTSIGECAFKGCSDLTSITLPNSITSIGEGAFCKCRRLTSVISDIQNPFSISDKVFIYISSNATLQVPKGTKSKYEAFTGWTNNFKEIIENSTGTTTYSLSITSSGNGRASYNDTSIRNSNQSFTVNEGTNATVSFTPDTGYRIKNVKVNSTDVTSSVSNNKYTISNINANTTLAVTFETIPPTTYTLSITASGNGSVMYNNTTIRNQSRSYTINEGDYATFVFTHDNGYRLGSVRVNNSDITYLVSNNQYSISSISQNTAVDVTFEEIPVPTYSLSIMASGNGSVSYNGTTVRNKTTSFTVNEGSDATITFSPDNGNSIASVRLNYYDVTAQVSSNRYTISNITANTKLEVTFQEDVNALTVDGLNYTVTSQSNKTVTFTGGDFGLVLTVPATVTQNGTTWKVTGIDNNVLKDDTELAAIIWNPEAAFTAIVSNPNLLLYVKASQYAPSTIKNVVVNGTANSITLTDAASGNNFYCPEAFTAQKISYSHHYTMMTGIGESRGWETIALPFDVQKIEHASKGTIVPFTQWRSGDTTKPFWLYELKSNGFAEASSIKANTPYIISMPNNPQYADQYQLVGNVTFSSENITISKSDNLQQPKYSDRTFVPNFQVKESDRGMYALNVNNDYVTNDTGMTEGSKFVMNMRQVHPFEAYMTTSMTNAPEFFDVFEGMTTDISELELMSTAENEKVYDLQGRRIIKNHLSKGIYIVNGQKIIIK